MPKKTLKGYHRFRGYDYSRGATLFVTIVTTPRQMIFGRVVDDRVEPNDCGRAAEETLRLEMKRNPALNVMAFVIMPDHVHFMIHVRAGTHEPLRQIGQFVANFKRWTKYKVEKLGVAGFGWQENYHDWICLSREAMDAVARYIKNNPLKWSLMHGADPPLRVAEPLDHARFPVGEWWSGVGRVELLEGKIAAIRLSRRIPERDFPVVVARLAGGRGLWGVWLAGLGFGAFGGLGVTPRLCAAFGLGIVMTCGALRRMIGPHLIVVLLKYLWYNTPMTY